MIMTTIQKAAGFIAALGAQALAFALVLA